MRSKTFQSPPKKKPPSRHPYTSMVPGDLPTTKKVRFEESGPLRPIPATPAAPIEESSQPSSLADSGRTELPATYLNHAQPTPDLIPSSPPPQTKLQPLPRRNPSRIVTKKPPSRHPSTSMVPGDLPATKKVHFKESGPPHAIPATPAAPMEESGQPSSLADSCRTELSATYSNHAQPTPDLIPSPPPPQTELQPPLRRNPSRIATKKTPIQPQSHPAAGTNKHKVVDGVSISKSYGKQPRIAIPSQGKKKVKPCRATVVGDRKIRHTRYMLILKFCRLWV